jgi:predicted ATPase/DNA-binding CsgD family transcriptional regulator
MQLPGSGKPFFGRDEERGRIAAALRTPGVRLVTLTGLGGIGKTALATRVMIEIAPHFPDGVHWIPLAAVTDPALVAAAINRELGIPDSGPRPPVDVLAEWLSGKDALLVLDNFEQVMEAKSLVAQLIAAADPGPVVLVTSREPLGNPGEYRIEIGPLPVVAPQQTDSDALRDNEAALLFEWRARFSGFDFAIDPSNADDVAEICRALDGIPLAIELAAARLHLLGVRGLRDHLRQPHLGFLRTGAADIPARQRAMSHVIGWSYNLLGERQDLFRRLCIFTGGFTLDAAEAVGLVEDRSEIAPSDAGLSKRDALLDRLEELIRLGLVRSQPQSDGTARLLILETIREFGLAQMSPDESTETNWALARYLMLFAERARAELSGADSSLWLDRLEAELGNLRHALAWLLQQDPAVASTVLRMGNALWVFWKTHGHFTEGRTWLLRIRDHAAQEESADLARIVLALGHLEFDNLKRSESFYAEARELFQRTGDQRGEAEAWGGLGMVFEQRGEYDRASDAHRSALDIWTTLGNERGVALASYQLGYAAIRAGAYDVALRYLDAARQTWETQGELDGVPYVIMEMGRANRLRGKFNEAGPLLNLCKDGFRRAGITDVEGIVETEIGLLLLAEGRTAAALAMLQSALRRFLELDVAHAYLFEAFEGIAVIASSYGDHCASLRLVLFVLYQRNRSGRLAPQSNKLLIEGAWRSAVKHLGHDVSAGIKAEADFLTVRQAADLAFTIQLPAQALAQAEPPIVKQGADAPYGKLTRKEREVLILITQGLSDQEIAERTSTAYRTVTTHVSHILQKLGVSSRTSAVAIAYQLGICKPPSVSD